MTKKELDAEAVRIIEALGGTGATAALFDIHPASVSGWKHHGIPRARLQFLQLLRPDLFQAVKKK